MVSLQQLWRQGTNRLSLCLFSFMPILAPTNSQSTNLPLTHHVWYCEVTVTLKGGQMRASRTYDNTGRLDSGDFFFWNATGYNPAQPRSPIEWDIGYIWSPVGSQSYQDRKAKLNGLVRLNEAMPVAGLLQISRPYPVEEQGAIGSTALTTTIFQTSQSDPNGGRGDLPLGDLLAYAGNYAQLDWRITKVHDQYGFAAPLAQGKVDIAALREASEAIPTLKAQLVTKAADFRKNCDFKEKLRPQILR
jgi:hypothetical protein